MRHYISVPAAVFPTVLTTKIEEVSADDVMPIVIIQPLRSNVVNANEQLVLAAGFQVGF